ncbi:MlaE family ABC transporter permease [Nocardioides sp. Root190]|uniref:MlaE family ABC transporter permease n=1 Tax=Nocardioides sp. Root190 TaxID=1736488 RepID=UPI000A64216A|nr:ABC transporter permease [Nocardioides sp. Root190]
MTATMPPPAPPGAKRAAAPAKRGGGSRMMDTVLVPAGEMGVLLGTVVWSAVRHPVGYWGEVRDLMFSMLKLCWIPMAISTVTFGFGAPGLQGGNIYNLFGIPERLGSFFIMASVREFAPWINAMIVAGVVGAAMTADLGARKIREEIDAMEVLGVDPIRDLIVPRVIAVTIMTGLLDLVALIFGCIGGYIAAVPILGASSGAFLSSFFANATVTDLWGSVLKTTIFGLVIAIVCCYKGLTVKGGPIGVGRAVNQAVVISFAAIFIINTLFTSILLGMNPDMQVYK